MLINDFSAYSLQGNREQNEVLTCESYFDVAVDELVSQDAGLNAITIWEKAVSMALNDVFGTTNDFELHFNYRNSYVYVDSVTAENIEDFDIKAEVFEDLIGFPIERMNRDSSWALKNRLCNYNDWGTETYTHHYTHISDAANIEINVKTAVTNLEDLKKNYSGNEKRNLAGFLLDIEEAIGLPNPQHKSSKYGFVDINGKQISVRLSNHNADCNTYVNNDNAIYPYNISIVIKRKKSGNTFKANDDVILDEYVFLGRKFNKTDNPFVKIIDSIIGFLRNGYFYDETGFARHNNSPTFDPIEDSIIYYDNCFIRRICF